MKSVPDVPPLRAVRVARGFSLRWTADRAEMDPAHLSRIERGLKRPSLPALKRLADVLELRELSKFLAPYQGDEEQVSRVPGRRP